MMDHIMVLICCLADSHYVEADSFRQSVTICDLAIPYMSASYMNWTIVPAWCQNSPGYLP